VIFVPKELKKDGLIMFRRMFKDSSPVMGKIILVGFDAVVAKIGRPGSVEEREVFVLTREICSIL